MSGLSQALLWRGATPLPVHGSFRSGVQYTGEFRRIDALPRRRWEEGRVEELIDLLTQELRTARGSMRLWPVQAAALQDVVLRRGAFLPVGVGQGKALVSLLAPVVLEAKRPLLVVPAQLREQTLAYVLPQMKQHWVTHPNLRIIGYSELSLAKNAMLLEEINPDVIILDECHSVKHLKAGRTRRMVRWFRDHPETLCIAMSGTVSNRSIRDFAHILGWCLKDAAPLPRGWSELSDWADAIDELKGETRPRVAAGALQRFCAPKENVRQGFRRRLTETPGVVATKENLLGTSLRIEAFSGLVIPESISSALHRLRHDWVTPGGDEIAEAPELWRHARELSLGFFYKWDPSPPKDWLIARSAWKKFVRETLKTNRRHLDTELQVWNECQRSELPEKHPWFVWAVLRDTFRPNTVPEWISDYAVQACCRWLEKPGICWIEQIAFGEAVAQASGRPYFGAGDDSILSCIEPSIIASQLSHSEGKNLQRYCRALVTSPMPSGKRWEQCLGRIHREGQQADEVTFEVFVHTPELLDAFAQALADARYLEDTLGNRQKLNFADVPIRSLLTHGL